MDVTEVNVCSPEERRFGELRERKEWSVKKILVHLSDGIICGLSVFRLQEQPAERKSPRENSAKIH